MGIPEIESEGVFIMERKTVNFPVIDYNQIIGLAAGFIGIPPGIAMIRALGSAAPGSLMDDHSGLNVWSQNEQKKAAIIKGNDEITECAALLVNDINYCLDLVLTALGISLNNCPIIFINDYEPKQKNDFSSYFRNSHTVQVNTFEITSMKFAPQALRSLRNTYFPHNDRAFYLFCFVHEMTHAAQFLFNGLSEVGDFEPSPNNLLGYQYINNKTYKMYMYHELPWEVDANNRAIEIVSNKIVRDGLPSL